MNEAAVARACAFDPAALSARSARRFVRGVLEEAGRPEWVESAELAVSEVVTNAVLHAHTAFEVRVEVRPEALRVEVLDHNPALPAARSYDVQATTGRGMELVAAVTSAHGVEPLGDHGKVVWFCVGGTPEEPDPEDLLDRWDDHAEAAWDPAGDPVPAGEPAGAAGRTGRPDPAPNAPVELRGMPPTLWLAVQQHHDALLRELALHRAVSGGGGTGEDLALADEARSQVDRAVERAVAEARAEGRVQRPLPAHHPAPLPAVPAALDLALPVRTETARAFAALQDVLDEGERLAAAGRLLVRPGLPEVVAVRDWACEQVIAQLHGAPPGAWVGAHDDAFATALHAPGSLPQRLGWDDRDVRESADWVVAADDANRIVAVSAPLAAELGWDPADLVGRRVVAIVPREHREAHVAGFTRHLTTGTAHVLGVPLVLPVLRADGGEVLCEFLIEAPPVPGGRVVYVARLTPAPALPAGG